MLLIIVSLCVCYFNFLSTLKKIAFINYIFRHLELRLIKLFIFFLLKSNFYILFSLNVFCLFFLCRNSRTFEAVNHLKTNLSIHCSNSSFYSVFCFVVVVIFFYMRINMVFVCLSFHKTY